MAKKRRKKIAVYTRVSSARQAADDAYSLEVQKERCTFLLKSKGYEENDIDFFTDAGISGTTIAERDELKELLEALERNEYDGICCYDLSRISRSISHTMEIFRLLKENQLKLFTCDGAFTGDINGQNAKIMVSIYSMLNELFIDQLRERVVDGMTKSVEAGNYYGGPAPLGYRYIYVNTKTNEVLTENNQGKNVKRKDIKKQLVIDENEKPVIELIFNLFTKEKHSIKGVAKYLNLHGYKTKTGNQFSTTSVQKILENPLYCGRLMWGKKIQKKKTEDGVRIWQKRTVLDVDFNELPKANHEPIVSEEFFLETAERLKERKQIRKNNNMAEKMAGITKQQYDDANKKMFVNLLKCPHCGGNMTSSLQPGYTRKDGTKAPAKVYYKCSVYNAGKNLCNGYYSVQEERAFNLIKEDFFKRLKEAFIMVKEYQNYIHEKHGTKEELLFDEELNKIKEEIKALEKNENRLTTKLDTLIERQLFEEPDSMKYKRIEIMIKDTEKEIKKVQEFKTEQQSKITLAQKRKETLLKESQEQEQFATMEEYFDSLSLLQKRKLLEKVYSKIVIDTISIAKFGPKKLKLKEIAYNQYSSLIGLCQILGVQDFHEFNNYLQTKGKKLNLLERYFGDSEEYIKELYKHTYSQKFKKYWEELDADVKEHHDEFLEQFMASIEDEMGKISMEEFEQKFNEALQKYREKHSNKKLERFLYDNAQEIFKDIEEKSEPTLA